MIKLGLLLAALLSTFSTLAANLSDIQVSNGNDRASITLSFSGQPVYGFFPLHNPERVVLDIRQSGIVKGLPLTFSGDNMVKRIRASTPKDKQSIRLVFELTQPGKTRAVTQRNGSTYNVVFTINGTRPAQRSAPSAAFRGLPRQTIRLRATPLRRSATATKLRCRAERCVPLTKLSSWR